MDALKAWLQDKKNLPIVGAGAGVILILVILFLLKMTGAIGGGQNTASVMPPSGGSGATSPGPPGGGAPLSAAGAPGMPGSTSPGAMPGATPGGSATASAAAKQDPMLPYRSDPFQPFAVRKIQRRDIIEALIPVVSRQRIAKSTKPMSISPASFSETTDTLSPQPSRRMAGVLIGGKISAILETNGEVDIVTPGMEISRGNSRVRVESIESDQIILKTLDTSRPMIIKVGLSGAVAGSDGGSPAIRPAMSGGIPPPPPM